MAASSSIPAFLLPRGGLSQSSLQYLRITPRRTLLHHASFSSSSASHAAPTKPRVLEKPDKFRPPSHPARRVVNPNKSPRNYPGPPPTAKEIEDRKTKRYPNMFPPEGTVLFKFLTNKGIHVWISMVSIGVNLSSSVKMLTLLNRASFSPLHISLGRRTLSAHLHTHIYYQAGLSYSRVR